MSRTLDATSRIHLKKLTDARNAFMRMVTGNRNAQKAQERVYSDLYEDIMANETFWFSQVFSRSSDLCEWTVGILGTQALIRRQWGDTRRCLEVLALDKRVLTLYQRIANYNKPPERSCVRNLTYKYNLIVVNANTQMGNKAPAVEAFRDAVKYVIEESYSFDQQQLGFMLRRLDNTSTGDYMTMECLNSTSDDFIWSTLMCGLEYATAADGTTNPRVEPWICDNCGAVEELCGDFKSCPACKIAEHWKRFHKAECKSRNKGKSPKSKVTNAN